jgi:hypothetical protein
VDRYTAYEDLLFIGFAFPSGDTRWSVRPAPTSKRPRTEPVDLEGDWIWIDDQRMFVVGRTPGGAPYGWVEDAE